MVLVPTTACKFLATWQGPYTVTEKVGPVTYRVRQPGRRKEDQLYHINLLKRWTQLAALATSDPGVVDMNSLVSDAQKKEGSQAEDCLLNPQRPLAVPGSPLLPARGTSNLPKDGGHPVAAPPVLRSRIP